MYDIECYDEKEFKRKYKAIYDEVLKIAKNHNIDISKFYFSQYVKFEKSEEVYYHMISDENTSYSIQWYDGNLKLAEVSSD